MQTQTNGGQKMNEDIYNSEYLETMVDNDEVSAGEAGFMQWYEQDEDNSFQIADDLEDDVRYYKAQPIRRRLMVY
jgi:hypothetical protein